MSDQNATTYFSAAALGALALLGGSYAAETARARSLRRHDTRVDGITLGAFGGQLTGAGEPGTPRALRRFAWSGPIALLLSAAASAGVAAGFASGTGSAPRLLAVTAVWVSALLGLFAVVELIPRPGSPGGQLVASRAWRRSGDRLNGEIATGKAGIRAGWTLGVIAAAGTLLLSPLAIWLLPVAFIAVISSRAQLAGATLRDGGPLRGPGRDGSGAAGRAGLGDGGHRPGGRRCRGGRAGARGRAAGRRR